VFFCFSKLKRIAERPKLFIDITKAFSFARDFSLFAQLTFIFGAQALRSFLALIFLAFGFKLIFVYVFFQKKRSKQANQFQLKSDALY